MEALPIWLKLETTVQHSRGAGISDARLVRCDDLDRRFGCFPRFEGCVVRDIDEVDIWGGGRCLAHVAFVYCFAPLYRLCAGRWDDSLPCFMPANT